MIKNTSYRIMGSNMYLPFTNLAFWGKLFNLFKPPFPHLKNEDNISTHLIRLFNE